MPCPASSWRIDGKPVPGRTSLSRIYAARRRRSGRRWTRVSRAISRFMENAVRMDAWAGRGTPAGVGRGRLPMGLNFSQNATDRARTRAIALELGRFRFHDAHHVDAAAPGPITPG